MHVYSYIYIYNLFIHSNIDTYPGSLLDYIGLYMNKYHDRLKLLEIITVNNARREHESDNGSRSPIEKSLFQCNVIRLCELNERSEKEKRNEGRSVQ